MNALYSLSPWTIIDLSPWFFSTFKLHSISASSISLNPGSRYYIWHYGQITKTFETPRFFQQWMDTTECIAHIALLPQVPSPPLHKMPLCVGWAAHSVIVQLFPFLSFTLLVPFQTKNWHWTHSAQTPTTTQNWMQQTLLANWSEILQIFSWLPIF